MRLAVLTPHPTHETDSRWEARLAALSSWLAEVGVDCVARAWTDEGALDGVDGATPLLAWGYHLKQEQWLSSLATWEAGPVPLANSAAILRWNSDKRYLLELEAKGAPVVPTLAVDTVTPEAIAQAHARFGPSLVAKPRVSAGAHQTARIEDGAISGEAPDGPALIQPFLPAVSNEGEISVFFFGGVFSHAVAKVARPGDFRVQPQYGSTLTRIDATAEIMEAAEAVRRAAPSGMAYARIDLIRDLSGRLALMELEAIEPDLYLHLAPEQAPVFARALLESLS